MVSSIPVLNRRAGSARMSRRIFNSVWLASVNNNRTRPISANFSKAPASMLPVAEPMAGNTTMPASVNRIGAVMTVFSSLPETRL